MANITVLNGTMDQKEIDQYVNCLLYTSDAADE